jgi:hypothetical protein
MRPAGDITFVKVNPRVNASGACVFRVRARTQTFLSRFGPTRQYFSLARHVLRTSLYRKHRAAPFGGGGLSPASPKIRPSFAGRPMRPRRSQHLLGGKFTEPYTYLRRAPEKRSRRGNSHRTILRAGRIGRPARICTWPTSSPSRNTPR